ncbi:MAG: hypothetical protein IIC21_10210 [Chloroflexi bacterium]|nr:hypothetical protein [Chloroflexota bacterium]
MNRRLRKRSMAALAGTKSLRTEKVSMLVLVIVHWPAATRAALHVPVDE